MNKNNIISVIKQEFKMGSIRNDMFPMMTKFGVRDYSETIHSLGLNYITAIGRSIAGISAISEYPAYPFLDNDKCDEYIAETNSTYGNKVEEIRPDSIWFSKEENIPILICEFERYQKNFRKDLKVKEKVENLLLAYHQLGGSIPIILLVYWSYSAENPAKIEEYISILDNGFIKSNGKHVQGINALRTTYLIYRCVASGSNENVKLNQWVEVG